MRQYNGGYTDEESKAVWKATVAGVHVNHAKDMVAAGHEIFQQILQTEAGSRRGKDSLRGTLQKLLDKVEKRLTANARRGGRRRR